LGSIGSALSREKLDSDSLVKILWPKEKCRLIRDDVVLVDRYKTFLLILLSSISLSLVRALMFQLILINGLKIIV
jgi:hypothetical protein